LLAALETPVVIKRPRKVESQIFLADVVATIVGGGFGMEALKWRGIPTSAGKPISLGR
jgi:hypothetical protein